MYFIVDAKNYIYDLILVPPRDNFKNRVVLTGNFLKKIDR